MTRNTTPYPCRRCGASLRWVLMTTGTWAAVNAHATTDGPIAATHTTNGWTDGHAITDAHPLQDTEHRFRPHVMDCPDTTLVGPPANLRDLVNQGKTQQ